MEEGRASDGEGEGQGQGVEEVELEEEADNVAAGHLRGAGGRDIVGFSGNAGVDAGRRWALDIGAAHLLQFRCAGAVLAAQEYPTRRQTGFVRSGLVFEEQLKLNQEGSEYDRRNS